MKNINPPGKWRTMLSGHPCERFVNSEIGAVYGLVELDIEIGHNQGWQYKWEARTVYPASIHPIVGYAESMEQGKRIVEAILWETNSCERGEETPNLDHQKAVQLAEYVGLSVERADEWGVHVCDIVQGRIERARSYLSEFSMMESFVNPVYIPRLADEVLRILNGADEERE